jgi:hypothetical protein
LEPAHRSCEWLAVRPAATTAPPLDHALARGTSSFIYGLRFDGSIGYPSARKDAPPPGRIVRSIDASARVCAIDPSLWVLRRPGLWAGHKVRILCAEIACMLWATLLSRRIFRSVVSLPSRRAPASPMNLWFIPSIYVQMQADRYKASAGVRARQARIKKRDGGV